MSPGPSPSSTRKRTLLRRLIGTPLTPDQSLTDRLRSLSWSDTAASTLGRLFSPHTPPLPTHFPLIPSLRFSPRKSLAGFLGALLTGTIIGLYFWSNGKHSDGGYGQLWGANEDLSGWAGERAGSWEFLGRSWGRWSTALVLGVGGAVVEALGKSTPPCLRATLVILNHLPPLKS